MVKSERIYSFFKRKTCDEDENNVSRSTKLEKLHENPRMKKMKK